MVNEKMKALADILSVDVSEIEYNHEEYCVNNNRIYEIIDKDDYDEVLDYEIDNLIDSMRYDLSHSDFSYLEGYIKWDKFVNDSGYDLSDFRWDEHSFNDKYYYIREI